MNKKIEVKCPQCQKKFFYYDSDFRPFCTLRCKEIDLGHWFKESYVVPLKEEVQNEDKKDEEKNEAEDDEGEYEY